MSIAATHHAGETRGLSASPQTQWLESKVHVQKGLLTIHIDLHNVMRCYVTFPQVRCFTLHNTMPVPLGLANKGSTFRVSPV